MAEVKVTYWVELILGLVIDDFLEAHITHWRSTARTTTSPAATEAASSASERHVALQPSSALRWLRSKR